MTSSQILLFSLEYPLNHSPINSNTIINTIISPIQLSMNIISLIILLWTTINIFEAFLKNWNTNGTTLIGTVVVLINRYISINRSFTEFHINSRRKYRITHFLISSLFNYLLYLEVEDIPLQTIQSSISFANIVFILTTFMHLLGLTPSPSTSK